MISVDRIAEMAPGRLIVLRPGNQLTADQIEQARVIYVDDTPTDGAKLDEVSVGAALAAADDLIPIAHCLSRVDERSRKHVIYNLVSGKRRVAVIETDRRGDWIVRWQAARP